MERRRKKIVEVLAEQAVVALGRGSRFQVRREVIGTDDDVRRLVNRLAVACGSNVRASQHDGLVTLYSEGSDLNTEVVVATVEIH